MGLNNGHTLHLAQLAFTLKCCSYAEVTSERNDVRYDLHKWQKKKKHLSVTAAWSGTRRQPGKDEANETPSVPCAHLLLPPFQIPLPPPIRLTLAVRPSTSDTVADCILTLEEWGGGDSCSLIPTFLSTPFSPPGYHRLLADTGHEKSLKASVQD